MVLRSKVCTPKVTYSFSLNHDFCDLPQKQGQNYGYHSNYHNPFPKTDQGNAAIRESQNIHVWALDNEDSFVVRVGMQSFNQDTDLHSCGRVVVECV